MCVLVRKLLCPSNNHLPRPKGLVYWRATSAGLQKSATFGAKFMLEISNINLLLRFLLLFSATLENQLRITRCAHNTRPNVRIVVVVVVRLYLAFTHRMRSLGFFVFCPPPAQAFIRNKGYILWVRLASQDLNEFERRFMCGACPFSLLEGNRVHHLCFGHSQLNTMDLMQ